jgi:hypothetical protein
MLYAYSNLLYVHSNYCGGNCPINKIIEALT